MGGMSVSVDLCGGMWVWVSVDLCWGDVCVCLCVCLSVGVCVVKSGEEYSASIDVGC